MNIYIYLLGTSEVRIRNSVSVAPCRVGQPANNKAAGAAGSRPRGRVRRPAGDAGRSELFIWRPAQSASGLAERPLGRPAGRSGRRPAQAGPECLCPGWRRLEPPVRALWRLRRHLGESQHSNGCMTKTLRAFLSPTPIRASRCAVGFAAGAPSGSPVRRPGLSRSAPPAGLFNLPGQQRRTCSEAAAPSSGGREQKGAKGAQQVVARPL